jgi:hypothetical protein
LDADDTILGFIVDVCRIGERSRDLHRLVPVVWMNAALTLSKSTGAPGNRPQIA